MLLSQNMALFFLLNLLFHCQFSYFCLKNSQKLEGQIVTELRPCVEGCCLYAVNIVHTGTHLSCKSHHLSIYGGM